MNDVLLASQGTVLLVSKRPYTAKDGEKKIFTEVSIRFEGNEGVFTFGSTSDASIDGIEGKKGKIMLAVTQYKTGVSLRFKSIA